MSMHLYKCLDKTAFGLHIFLLQKYVTTVHLKPGSHIPLVHLLCRRQQLSQLYRRRWLHWKLGNYCTWISNSVNTLIEAWIFLCQKLDYFFLYLFLIIAVSQSFSGKTKCKFKFPDYFSCGLIMSKLDQSVHAFLIRTVIIPANVLIYCTVHCTLSQAVLVMTLQVCELWSSKPN